MSLAIANTELNPGRNEASEPGVVDASPVDFGLPHEYVDIDHSQLAYWQVGQGPNLILVHGWPLHSATYRHLLPFLSKHYCCHLFDLPGAGQSRTGETAPFGIRSHGESLLKGIRAKGICDYALLGHDSGAAIMQFTAANAPENVKAMIMGNTETPGYHSTMMKMLMLLARLPKGPDLFFRALGFKVLRRSSLGLGGCFTDATYGEGEFFRLFIEPILSSAEMRRRQAQLLKHFSEADIRALIQIQQNNTVPVQLLWGAQDRYFLLNDAKKMQKRFKGPSEIQVLPQGKLFLHEDHARWFIDHALPFLKQYHAGKRA
jgi:haloalkane dehalogenase